MRPNSLPANWSAPGTAMFMAVAIGMVTGVWNHGSTLRGDEKSPAGPLGKKEILKAKKKDGELAPAALCGVLAYFDAQVTAFSPSW